MVWYKRRNCAFIIWASLLRAGESENFDNTHCWWKIFNGTAHYRYRYTKNNINTIIMSSQTPTIVLYLYTSYDSNSSDLISGKSCPITLVHPMILWWWWYWNSYPSENTNNYIHPLKNKKSCCRQNIPSENAIKKMKDIDFTRRQ